MRLYRGACPSQCSATSEEDSRRSARGRYMNGRRNQLLVELNGQLRMQRRFRAALAGWMLQPGPIAATPQCRHSTKYGVATFVLGVTLVYEKQRLDSLHGTMSS